MRNSLTTADVISSYVGESERNLAAAFATATAAAPAVLFIDELDSLARRRTSSEDETTRRVKTTLLLLLDSVSAASDVIVLAATNCPHEIDSAVLRRFSRTIHVPLPTADDRVELLSRALASIPHSLSGEQLRQAAMQANLFSGAGESARIF